MDVATPVPEQLRWNFSLYSLVYAINHGAVTAPLVLATATLDGNVGYRGDALLYVFTLISSFLLAAPVVECLDIKRASMLAMLLYTTYSAFFALALLLADRFGMWLQLLLFCTGSSVGGLAAGIFWAAQGAYFSRSVDLLVESELSQREDLTSELSGKFAFFYLLFDLICKLLWSALDWSGVPPWLIASLYTAVGFLTLIPMSQTLNLSSTSRSSGTSSMQRMKATASLWKDPAIFLIGGLNLTFGFSAALMNGYVNGEFTAKQLGSFAVAMLAALTSLTAALVSNFLGPVGARIGKGPIVFFGAVCCFLGIPFSILSLGCCKSWGWWLTTLYLLQGGGRGVFESTNKGVFSDFFPEDPTAAFANQQLQTTMAFALCFFLSERLKEEILAYIVLLTSLMTPLGFWLAGTLRHKIYQSEESDESCAESN
mmetsp:Transcript_153/g.335  ORF Transcript_153/g.335 Transcript_153/m.335 type:complete len:428 (+) Transcript_153:119-1402(+)